MGIRCIVLVVISRCFNYTLRFQRRCPIIQIDYVFLKHWKIFSIHISPSFLDNLLYSIQKDIWNLIHLTIFV